jgi:DNA-binding response OmpR family regulator
MTDSEMDYKARILVVEDEESLRDLYREALEVEGYVVIAACDGVEGLEKFRDEDPDIVLLDLMMPKLDGWEVLEKIRQVSDSPVIIVTGQGTAEDIIKGLLEAGADDYLVKPFGIRELQARIIAVLRRSVATGR